MTSLQIEYFLKVTECMSFSQVAKELYVSQPSVSRQIRQLEQELGVQLFDRTCRNAVTLTAAGMVFRDTFHGIRKQYRLAQSTAKKLSTDAPLSMCVGIGSGWDLSRELETVEAEIRMRYPYAEITFECRDFQELRQCVRAGSLDAALFTKTSLLDFDGLHVEQIADMESRAYVRRGLLRSASEPLRAEDFNGQHLMMLSSEESPMAMELARLQFQARQVSVIPEYLPNRDSILQALLLGKGVTVFDQYMWFGNDPRLDWFSLEDDIPVCVVWRSDNLNPLIPLFADSMRQVMN